jgi:hypothetical protein
MVRPEVSTKVSADEESSLAYPCCASLDRPRCRSAGGRNRR